MNRNLILSSLDENMMYDYNNLSFHNSDHNLSLPTTPGSHTKPNGILSSRPSSLAKRSISRLSVSPSRVTLYGRDYGVTKSLASLIFMTIISLVMAIVATVLLFKLHSKELLGAPSVGGILKDDTTYADMLEVAMAITTFVIVLDYCCVLVCSIQFFFSAKILKVPQGEDRAFKYLKSCAGIRFISVSGFFISIPAYLISLFLYMMMEFESTPAIISMCITGCGFVFCVAAVIQSIYHWRVEKNRANLGLPVFEEKKHNDSELSTLV